jgi:hypothetical protein
VAHRTTNGGGSAVVGRKNYFLRNRAKFTAACVSPISEEVTLPPEKRAAIDQHYAAIDTAINNLLTHVGLKAA